MEVAYLLTFAGGMAVGLIAACLALGLKLTHAPVDLEPELMTPTCVDSGGNTEIQVPGSADATVGDLKLVDLFAVAFNPSSLPADLSTPPDPSAGLGTTSFPVKCPAATLPSGKVVVWAKYETYGHTVRDYTCS